MHPLNGLGLTFIEAVIILEVTIGHFIQSGQVKKMVSPQ